jgi:hypothetical protein
MLAKVNKLILLLMVATALMVSVVGADTLSNSSYTINVVIPGGGQTLQNTSYTLYDLKGQGIAGSLANTPYTVGLGGIYGLMGGGVGPQSPLNIARGATPGDIVLSWTGAAPDIWYMVGDDGTGKYQNNWDTINTWKKVIPGTTGVFSLISSGTSLTHLAADASKHAEVYYKAYPVGLTPPGAKDSVSGLTAFEAAPAVGKVDVVMHGGWNSVSLPFTGSQFGGASGLVGDNFGEGDTAGFWDYSITGAQDMTANKRFSVSSGWDNPTVSSPLAQGGMFNIASLKDNKTRTVTLIGGVPASATSRDINPRWNHIGSPLPKGLQNGAFVSANVNPANQLVIGDTIQRWGGTDFDFTTRYLGNDTWDQPLNFNPGVGYWFNHVSTANKFKWTPK